MHVNASGRDCGAVGEAPKASRPMSEFAVLERFFQPMLVWVAEARAGEPVSAFSALTNERRKAKGKWPQVGCARY